MSDAPKPTPPVRGRIFQRGDIWMVREDLAHPAIGTENWSNRPALIVSSDVYNLNSGFVQIVYLTTSPKKKLSPTHIKMDVELREGATTIALCEQIHTVDTTRLEYFIDHITLADQGRINCGLTRSLGIIDTPDMTLNRAPKTMSAPTAPKITAVAA